MKEVEELYRLYGPLVLRRARAIIGDEDGARDALQEIFIRVMRSIDSFRGDASPATWLYRMATNHCLNVIRDRQRRALLLESNLPIQLLADPACPDDRMTITQILLRLPEELREIAVFYYVDHMSREEIAGLLGTSPRTIGNRLAQFRELAQSASKPAPGVTR